MHNVLFSYSQDTVPYSRLWGYFPRSEARCILVKYSAVQQTSCKGHTQQAAKCNMKFSKSIVTHCFLLSLGHLVAHSFEEGKLL